MFGLQEKLIALPISPVLRPAKKPKHFREGICLLVSLLILCQLYVTWQYFPGDLLAGDHENDQAANSTLGFSNIYAVSRQGSSRRSSLQSAAELTGLDISIPIQPIWSDEDVASMQAPRNSLLDRGSALAWLGHRNVLAHFLNSTDETALIIEDDVDWDTRLRTTQIPQTAYAIRELLNSHEGYYGDTNSWDIIWLGHCGDYFDANRGMNIPNIKAYADPAMPTLDRLHSWTRDFLLGLGAENQQRLVHKSVSPLCSFAYAVTRPAAMRLYNELAVREPSRGQGNPCKAYDVRLLEACRDEGMKCITVNPELFHHSHTQSEIAQATENNEQGSSDASAEGAVTAPTVNIRCSARSSRWEELRNSIADPTVDVEALVRDLAQQSSDCYIDEL